MRGQETNREALSLQYHYDFDGHSGTSRTSLEQPRQVTLRLRELWPQAEPFGQGCRLA